MPTQRAMEKKEETTVTSAKAKEEDPILDMAVSYVLHGTYQEDLSKDKKRAIRKKAQSQGGEWRGVAYLTLRSGRLVCWVR